MSFRKNFVIGLMLFALFLGAGNIIFPPLLGQMAGDDLFIAMAGFLITGVGLPLLAILAIANAGEGGLQSIASRVHPFIRSFLHDGYLYGDWSIFRNSENSDGFL